MKGTRGVLFRAAVVVAAVALGMGIFTREGARPTLRLRNVSGPATTAPHGGAADVFWFRSEQVLISRWWQPAGGVFVARLTDGTRTAFPAADKSGPSVQSVSPDGRYALLAAGRVPLNGSGHSEAAHLVETDATTANPLPVTDRVGFLHGVIWTRDGRFWVAQGQPGPWRATKKTATESPGFLAFPVADPSTAPRPTPERKRTLTMIGADADNRILCLDYNAVYAARALRPVGGRGPDANRSSFVLTLSAFPVDARGNVGAPAPIRITLPRHNGRFLPAVSPDGRRVALMTTNYWRIPKWAHPLWIRLRLSVPTYAEIWVADLDGSPARLHAAFPLSNANRAGGRVIVDFGRFQWSPDGRQFGFLLGDDFYTYPAPPPARSPAAP